MPQRSLSPLRLRGGAVSAPPPVMTWPKAMLIIVPAVVVDFMSAFFHLFGFLAPALAALYCTSAGGDYLASWTFGLLGTGTAAVVCTSVAAVAGTYFFGPIEAFGSVMAGAVGFMGFLALGLGVVMTNARIFKAIASAPVQFAGAFAVGEVPFLGALPFYSYILWRLYGKQIRIEKAALKKWQEETAAARLQEQRQQALAVAHIQASQEQADVQQRRIVEREEAEYADYQQQLAANDGQYEIPEDERKAA